MMRQLITHHKNPKPKNNRGFTLVELMLYMTMLTGFLIILTNIFTSSFDVQLDSESHSSVEQDGRYILSRLSYDMQRAEAITIPAALGDQGSTLTITIDGINNTYTITNNNLTLTNSNGTNQLNGSRTQISNLQFRRIGNSGVGNKDTIQLQFTLTSRVQRSGGQQDIKNFQTALGLR